MIRMRWAWLMLFAACAPVMTGARGECQKGEISYYAASLHGRKTASGEAYDHDAMTAAHRKLAFGSRVRVEFRGKSVLVRVNDRGPFAKNRILDLSGRAAKEIGLMGPGHGEARVCVE